MEPATAGDSINHQATLSPIITGLNQDRVCPGAHAPGFTPTPASQAGQLLGTLACGLCQIGLTFCAKRCWAKNRRCNSSQLWAICL